MLRASMPRHTPCSCIESTTGGESRSSATGAEQGKACARGLHAQAHAVQLQSICGGQLQGIRDGQQRLAQQDRGSCSVSVQASYTTVFAQHIVTRRSSPGSSCPCRLPRWSGPPAAAPCQRRAAGQERKRRWCGRVAPWCTEWTMGQPGARTTHFGQQLHLNGMRAAQMAASHGIHTAQAAGHCMQASRHTAWRPGCW